MTGKKYFNFDLIFWNDDPMINSFIILTLFRQKRGFVPGCHHFLNNYLSKWAFSLIFHAFHFSLIWNKAIKQSFKKFFYFWCTTFLVPVLRINRNVLKDCVIITTLKYLLYLWLWLLALMNLSYGWLLSCQVWYLYQLQQYEGFEGRGGICLTRSYVSIKSLAWIGLKCNNVYVIETLKSTDEVFGTLNYITY